MKAVQIVRPEELRVIDVEKPSITEHDNVLVRMTAAGICGSDIGIYHGTNAAATYPAPDDAPAPDEEGEVAHV